MDKNLVSCMLLEERVAMYLQAIEFATAANDGPRRKQLEQDIQTLMDLMEQMRVGQVVTANRVPPALQLHSLAGEPLANPLGELSSRLADYHKALYYADIEIGEHRTQNIQTLQRGLQVIQKLQEKAQAGFPIQAEEIPPPVTIPTDDEFVVDPKSVITERMALYYQAIELAEEGDKSPVKKRTRVNTLQEGLQKLNYLLKRAESNIPIYKKDLPCSPALGKKFRQQTEQYRTTVELLTKMSGLSARAAKLASARGDREKEQKLLHNAKMLTVVLRDYEMGKPLDMSACPYSLEDIQQLADQAGVPASQHLQDVETVRLRGNQYKLAALKAKRSGNKDLALQHMRIVKGLQSLLHAAEKGELDMTQVPPPPQEQTPTTEEEARQLTLVPPESTLEEEGPGPSIAEEDGMSLAEELSAFLNQPSSSEDSTSVSESSSSDSPERGTSFSKLTDFSPVPTKPRMQGSSRSAGNGNQNLTPGSSMSSSLSGLNPLYTMTQSDPTLSQSLPVPTNVPSSQPGFSHPSWQPGVVPSRALKPLMNFDSSERPGEQSSVKTLNGGGFHGNDVVLEPVEQIRRLPGTDDKGNLGGEVPMQGVMTNGGTNSRHEMTCIEILKYERTHLDKEGSEKSREEAERLLQQMEEEKQRLRVGGYEAWLAYLGQVEEDVTHINRDMKLARHQGQEHSLSCLIIKKELAERELAVMRKRLPELQS